MEGQSVTEATRQLTKAIREIPGLHIAYQANIAMSMVDECERQGLDLDMQVVHKLANDGAKRFLDMWTEERPSDSE